jgi:peptidoglycan hydrolase-like protein with peptidoglycan-binding domain
MKLTTALLLAALLCPAVAGAARHKPRARHHAGAHRARRTRRAAGPLRVANPGAARDEIELSPSLMRRLQANLFDGGYLHGTLDGRLTPRTRRALAAFQRDYHLAPKGDLSRATAEALLGSDVISAFLATRD